MGLAERRKALGYSQENLAELVGVDRTTVGRWESGRVLPHPQQRIRLAGVLELGLKELDALLAPPGTEGGQRGYQPIVGDPDDVIRREFLRMLTVGSALAALPSEEAEAQSWAVPSPTREDFGRMNDHLWQVYQLARSKEAVYPLVRDQLATFNAALSANNRNVSGTVLRAAADLFQLAGEVSFDANRYTDAEASYTLAASVSRDARAFDLWACALIRRTYIDVSERRFLQAVQTLEAAERLARHGDSALATRHWVAAVQAQAYAGLGDLSGCERALERAEQVANLGAESANGGWLRFDGSRLAEERGARYVELGRLDLAEATLEQALQQNALASGQSYRRRGAVLTDLAAIGAKRRDSEQLVAHGREALRLAHASSSGYVARRLRTLSEGCGALTNDRRVAELRAEIVALNTP
ncbi:helix-turn-helix transcriptional regulator [Uniformispora flossi]|uniref:helix-turn-helix transcriptional regulator n=1 Tax=Uniformispora flossi TaxID=3390723 RepID=UPI003C2BD066